MGGAIAGVYASEHPEDVAELALVDSFGLKFKENEFAKEAMSGKDPFIFNDRAGFLRANALAFEHVPNIPGRFIDVLVKDNIKNRAFIENTFNELREDSQVLSLQSRLDKLTMPTLGMWCHDDKIIPTPLGPRQSAQRIDPCSGHQHQRAQRLQSYAADGETAGVRAGADQLCTAALIPRAFPAQGMDSRYPVATPPDRRMVVKLQACTSRAPR